MTKNEESNQAVPGSRVSQAMLIPLMLGTALLWGYVSTLDVVEDALGRRDRFILDGYHRHGVKTPVQDDVVVIGIDDASMTLDSLWPEDIAASPTLSAMKKGFPYPRRIWATLLDKMFDAGAKAVFLDLTFPLPSNPEDDHILRESLEKYKGRVVVGAKFEQESAGENIRVDLKVPTSEIFDLKDRSFGLLNFWPDFDDIIRTADFRMTHSDVMRMTGDQVLVNNPDEEHYQHAMRLLASIANPESLTNLPDRVDLRFSAAGSYEPISLVDIFVDNTWKDNFGSGAKFKDKVVLVGAVSSTLQDFQQTPLGRVAGVQLHAQAYGSIVSHSFLHSAPGWWTWAALAGALLIAWAAVTWIRQPILCFLVLVGLSVGGIYVGAWLFDHRNFEISPLPFGLPLLICGFVGLAGDSFLQMREKRKLQRLLARYTSPELMREMMKDRAGLYTTLRGVGRNVTVLFSDVRGFTSMSENMTPAEVVSQLNQYLSRMVEKVFRQRGIVDKFIGDAVMAVWGSTRSMQDETGFKEDAINAVSSALAMRMALEELNKDWASKAIAELHFGIGIHQGPVVVGNIGSESPFEKMDFTVIGDAVNTASRLESATKQYGLDLLISADVQRHIGEDFICRSADLVVPVGKRVPVEVFTVTGMRSEGPPAGLDEFEAGVVLYRAGDFEKALEAFAAAALAGLSDSLTQEYMRRCQSLMATPPENWKGVYVMTKK